MPGHSISESSQCSTGLSSQALPSIRQPGDGVTWMRKGTLGSTAGWGTPPARTSQDLLIPRSSASRALRTSWSISVVASASRSQFTCEHSLGVTRRLNGESWAVVPGEIAGDSKPMVACKTSGRGFLWVAQGGRQVSRTVQPFARAQLPRHVELNLSRWRSFSSCCS